MWFFSQWEANSPLCPDQILRLQTPLKEFLQIIFLLILSSFVSFFPSLFLFGVVWGPVYFLCYGTYLSWQEMKRIMNFITCCWYEKHLLRVKLTIWCHLADFSDPEDFLIPKMWSMTKGCLGAKAWMTVTDPPGRCFCKGPWEYRIQSLETSTKMFTWKRADLHYSTLFEEVLSCSGSPAQHSFWIIICWAKRDGLGQSGLYSEAQGWCASEPVAHWVPAPWNLCKGTEWKLVQASSVQPFLLPFFN